MPASGKNRAGGGEVEKLDHHARTIERLEGRTVWPVTPAEGRIASGQGTGWEAPSVALTCRLSGELDAERLERAIRTLVRRNRILRSYYPTGDGGKFVHRIADDMPVSLVRVDCKDMPGKLGELELAGAPGFPDAQNMPGGPFDISRGPLYRFALYDDGSDGMAFSIVLHHIIADARSIGLFADELWEIYRNDGLRELAGQAGKAGGNGAEPDFLDYAAWLEENGDPDDGIKYFMDVFADGVPENEMPIRFARPDRLPSATETKTREMAVTLDEIDEKAKNLGVPPFTLIFAAISLSLAKYCGSEDIVLGVAMSGRKHPGTAGMKGMFANVLPVRVKPAGDKTFETYIGQIADAIRGAKEHETCPFEPLAAALAPDRNPSRNPIFDVIVNSLSEKDMPKIPNLDIKSAPITGTSPAIDMLITVRRSEDELTISASSSEDLYHGQVIGGFLDLLAEIIKRITGSDSFPDLSALAELPDAAREQILRGFAGERSDEDLGRTVLDIFCERAKEEPERTAVAFAGKSLTYGELDRVTDALAASLAAIGVGRGDRVGALVRRSELMAVCAIGALKTGAAYVPLDPGYPSERLSFMLKDSAAKAVLADRELTGLISGFDGEILTTDKFGTTDAPSGESAGRPQVSDAFVTLYTSGTTGQPKGVTLTHGNLANFCSWYAREHKLTSDDRVAAYASFGFDACLMDFYPALSRGACVHVIPEEMRLDLPRLNDYFNENGITVVFMTTQLGRQFVEIAANDSLRVLSVGGESLVPIAPPEGFSLYNCYGPTECTVLSTFFRVDRLYGRVPLGRPVANTDIYIVDGRGRLAPVGTAGELCVAGRQVSAGYLGRPELTAEKFVKNPFNGDPEYSRMYKTGDVARYLPSGDIDFIGRHDFQVKIRGFRVELTEIELRIRAYRGVKDAAVVPADAPGGGKCAVAYVASDSPIDTAALNAFIEEKLPPYMVPAATMRVDAIPLNQNGKVDRRKLPPPVFGASPDEDDGGTRVRTDLEIAIADVLAGILGHSEFGLATNLLSAGLTSLSAIRLCVKLDERLGVAPQIHELMKSPNILGIENAMIRTLLSAKRAEETEGTGSAKETPLSQSQMGVCYDCMKRPDSTVYNIPIRIDLPPGIDAMRLAAAAAAVIDAHPAVKSRLAMSGDDVTQVPDDTPAVVLCRDTSEEELEKIAEDFVRPFALFKGPLYRAGVYRTPSGVTMLADFHHVVFDGGSLDIFLREVGSLYGDEAFPQKVRAAREKISCGDWALIEKKNEGSDEWLLDKRYFDETLAAFDGASELPGDLPAGEKTEHQSLAAEFAAPVSRSLAEGFCRANGTSPAGLFLAALSYTLSRFIYSPDVYIATISSGRGDLRLQNSFGMFVRTLPLAIHVGHGGADGQDEISSLAFVLSCGDELRDAVSHEGYPFTRIAQEKGFEPSIMYACQIGLVEEHKIGGERAALTYMSGKEPMFKLSVFVEERGGDFAYVFQYDSSRYSAGLIERFAEATVTALQNIASKPASPLRKVSLVSERAAELLKSFNRWDETADALPEPVLHRMFESAARRFPDKTAVIASDREYTYAELDAEANRIANALSALGAKSQDRVAFMLHRTGRILVAIFGALKAGCAYIPIDPEYPAERIEHVLNESGAKFLLTSGDQEKIASLVNSGGASETRILDIDSICDGASPENPGISVTPDQLAYLIFTSGSTGKPKGVMIEHRGIANFVTDHPKNGYVRALVRDDCRMLSITTVAFDMFTIESLIPLCNGLTMVLANDAESRDPELMAELMQRTGADAVDSTPTRMMEYTEFPALLEAVRKCKVIITGGEKYPEALLARLRAKRQYPSGLFNAYGPTEISVACNCKDLTNAERITVGPPLLGVRETVVDSDGNALPPGVVGELWTGGRGVGRGYINRPEQTAERFVTYGGERVYKCGDFARWTDDGEIEILGRNDNQIKLRGLRIELGEIESAISSVEGVRSCEVMIRHLQNSDHICAYYVADKPIDPIVMRELLGKTLTPYMVPTAYKQLEFMPKTPNGKNDTRALPDPDLLNVTDYEAPKTPLEETLCSVFEKVLGLERVGANDNFFEIGGSSLAVTRVVLETKERIPSGPSSPSISYGDVFANPTPRKLASILAGGGSVTAMPEYALVMPDYDYGRINEILSRGTLENFKSGPRRPLGDVLLTGATGFLGAHILRELLKDDDGGAIYCLLRRGRYDSVDARLKNMLYYYFEDDFERFFAGRLYAVEGDITRPESLRALESLPVKTVINSAANVTHFAKDSSISDVNTGGVLNLIEFSLRRNARLVQISTASVAGFSVDGVPPADMRMDETMLYFGQNLENQYIHSKFMAERAILEAVERGLDAKIMRAGNLMARNRDGEFQINSHANTFLGRLSAYQAVGCFPYSSYLESVELSPIDSTAKAVLLLSDAPEECRVFHTFSNHRIFMGDIVSAMRDEGIEAGFAEDDEFGSALSSAMKDPRRAERLTSLIAYQNVAQGRAALQIDAKNDYTSQALYRRNWSWPETNHDYMRKFLQGMIGLGYFGDLGETGAGAKSA
jgi:amino acid adenylation domain-containing protein